MGESVTGQPGDLLEVLVIVQRRGPMALCDSADEQIGGGQGAVVAASHGLLAQVERARPRFVIAGQVVEARQEGTKFHSLLRIAGGVQDLHLDRPGDGQQPALVERVQRGEKSAFDVLVFCPSPTEGAPRAVILGMLARRPTLSSGPEGVDDVIVVCRQTGSKYRLTNSLGNRPEAWSRGMRTAARTSSTTSASAAAPTTNGMRRMTTAPQALRSEGVEAGDRVGLPINDGDQKVSVARVKTDATDTGIWPCSWQIETTLHA